MESPRSTRAARRPGPVWVIVILCLLAAGAQLLNQLTAPRPTSPELRAYVDSWTILDKWIPYVLDGLLILAAASLFALQARAVGLFAAYAAVGAVASVQHALTTRWLDVFGWAGIAAVGVGLALSLLVLLYVIRLRSRGVLT